MSLKSFLFCCREKYNREKKQTIFTFKDENLKTKEKSSECELKNQKQDQYKRSIDKNLINLDIREPTLIFYPKERKRESETRYKNIKPETDSKSTPYIKSLVMNKENFPSFQKEEKFQTNSLKTIFQNKIQINMKRMFRHESTQNDTLIIDNLDYFSGKNSNLKIEKLINEEFPAISETKERWENKVKMVHGDSFQFTKKFQREDLSFNKSKEVGRENIPPPSYLNSFPRIENKIKSINYKKNFNIIDKGQNCRIFKPTLSKVKKQQPKLEDKINLKISVYPKTKDKIQTSQKQSEKQNQVNENLIKHKEIYSKPITKKPAINERNFHKRV